MTVAALSAAIVVYSSRQGCDVAGYISAPVPSASTLHAMRWITTDPRRPSGLVPSIRVRADRTAGSPNPPTADPAYADQSYASTYGGCVSRRGLQGAPLPRPPSGPGPHEASPDSNSCRSTGNTTSPTGRISPTG